MVKFHLIVCFHIYMFIWLCLEIMATILRFCWLLHHELRQGPDIRNRFLLNTILLGVQTHLISLGPKESILIEVIWKSISNLIMLFFRICHIILLHLLITVLAWRAVIATRASAPLEFLHFENLFGFWSTLRFWIIDFVEAPLAVQDLLHLLFGYESSVVPKPILCEIFSARIPHMILVDPGFLFFPVF